MIKRLEGYTGTGFNERNAYINFHNSLNYMHSKYENENKKKQEDEKSSSDEKNEKSNKALGYDNIYALKPKFQFDNDDSSTGKNISQNESNSFFFNNKLINVGIYYGNDKTDDNGNKDS